MLITDETDEMGAIDSMHKPQMDIKPEINTNMYRMIIISVSVNVKILLTSVFHLCSFSFLHSTTEVCSF